MTEQQIEEYAQELLWKYQADALPYFERAKDLIDGKVFELNPTEDSFCDNLLLFKKSFLDDMSRVPLIKSANTYLVFCKKYKITPEEEVSDREAKSALENVYANLFLQLIEYGEKNYPENDYIKKIINETKETFLQYLEKKKQENAERKAAEKAKAEEERNAADAAKRFIAMTLSAMNEEEAHKEDVEKSKEEEREATAKAKNEEEDRQSAEEKAKKEAIKAERVRIRKEKMEQKKIEEKKKKQFRAKIYFLACIAIVGIVLLSCSYEWYHYVLTIAGMGVIYYLWFFQNLDKLYGKALEALDLYDIML